MAKKHFKLQHSESVIVQAAAQIYAAYIAAGRVAQDNEPEWMKRSIREAIMIARSVDDAVISDGEMESSEGGTGIASGRKDASRSRHQS